MFKSKTSGERGRERDRGERGEREGVRKRVIDR